MDKSKTIEGIILSRKDIGEADRILSVFSKSEGKIKIIARGTRKLKSKNACHIEPFTIGKYSIVPGKTFYVLTGADSLHINQNITNDLEKYKSGAYLCELLNLVGLEGQMMPKTYERFKKNLIEINDGIATKIDFIISEYILLSEMGYSADYINCKKCNSKLTETNLYQGDFEGVLCPECSSHKKELTKDIVKILRLLEKEEFDKIKNIKTIERHCGDLEKVVSDYLLNILPKAPKSRFL